MKRIVFTFGTIAGLICGGLFYLNIPEDGEKMNFDGGAFVGYLTMVIALSSIFFAVRQYRDKHLDGVIDFKTSFLIGIYITWLHRSFMWWPGKSTIRTTPRILENYI